MHSAYFSPLNKKWRLFPLVIWVFSSLCAQTPFLRTGQVFVIDKNTNYLKEFTVPSNNSINSLSIGVLPAGGFDALGFRITDNFLYAVAVSNNHLFKIGQNAAAQDLGAIGLDPLLYYLAGDISPDGRYFYCVGSDAAGVDVHLARIDLNSPGFSTQILPLNGIGHLADIAFDPTNGRLFGFDKAFHRVVTISPGGGTATALQTIGPANNIYGLYFDAFGDMYGIGSSLSGVVDALFLFDKNTGKETRLTTGATSMVADVASCPFSVELKCDVDPENNLPCTEINYTYTMANRSGETISGIEFQHTLPTGFHLSAIVSNTFGAIPDTGSIPGTLRLENMTIVPGVRNLKVKMAIGDIPKGKYNSQPVLNMLPPIYGSTCLSNYNKAPGFEDSTAFFVNRFDEDSLNLKYLLCHGETLLLQSSAYGNNVLWNNGSAASSLSVTQGGLYSFVAGSACESIVVNHDVTSTSCPFTISIAHDFKPAAIFACNELICRFIINNDSGEPRSNLSFVDTLPANFTVLNLEKNPFGGDLLTNLLPNIIQLNGMTLPVGIDTLKVRIRVGDVPPGDYKNRAVLSGFPAVMGPIRLSDDPTTFSLDSSTLHIMGTLSDSMVFDEIICPNTSINLDASALGVTFLWEDGSTQPVLMVEQSGLYALKVVDGCSPATIFWNVAPGIPIEIAPLGPFLIHQGEAITLTPVISNSGNSLDVIWTDNNQSDFSCFDCLTQVAVPLESTLIGLKASNEQCSDSISVWVEVDQSRRIYAPNIFSPNSDGFNDFFYLQSPDYGNVLSMRIYDRWGILVFQAKNEVLEVGEPSWDGYYLGNEVPEGVYVWLVEIAFIDGKQQVFSGDVTVLR